MVLLAKEPVFRTEQTAMRRDSQSQAPLGVVCSPGQKEQSKEAV